jgi:hypothetical protein
MQWLIAHFSETKLGDWLLITFNGLLVLVGYLQYRTFKTQATIMKDTREIAIASLGRPHVFCELLSHNFEEWREKRTEKVCFFYHFTNYGNGPAIVSRIFARGILSRGPGFGEDEETTIIVKFPQPNEMVGFFSWIPNVYVAEEKPFGWEAGQELPQDRAFVLSPQSSSRVFATVVRSIPLGPAGVYEGLPRDKFQSYLYKETDGGQGWVAPWLIGQLIYFDTFGQGYLTSFCFRAWRNGSFSEQEGPPFNERT